jgi:hypothetical protein
VSILVRQVDGDGAGLGHRDAAVHHHGHLTQRVEREEVGLLVALGRQQEVVPLVGHAELLEEPQGSERACPGGVVELEAGHGGEL